MKKNASIVDEINSALFESWEAKKRLFKKPSLEVTSLFGSCAEMVMYYLRCVVSFNIKKTSLA